MFLIPFLALLGSSCAAPSLKSARQADDTTTSTNVTLSPVSVPADNTDAFTPSVNVSLPYGVDQTQGSAVNVGLTTAHASLLLEAISSLVSVDCSSDSVSMTFDNADDLDSAYSEWSSHPLLVLVTNHMGDCDTEFERGFFVADSYTTDESTLTLVASTTKSSINDVASYIRTDFSGLPLASGATKTKRGLGEITYSPDPINFTTNLVLNETVLFEYDPYFTATLDSGSLSLSVTVGGTLVYNILTSTLVELEVYLQTNTTSDVVLDLDFAVPYNKTFSYGTDVELYVIDIPGILTFGPEIAFEIGADVAADAGVDVLLDLSSAIYNGNVTLDYVGNLTYSGYWDPTFDVAVTISEEAGVEVTPFITSSFVLDIGILGGAYNATGGIAPSVGFPTEISLALAQEIGTPAASDANVVACTQGLGIESNFTFALDAFVTGRWNDEYLYNVTLPILDKCIS